MTDNDYRQVEGRDGIKKLFAKFKVAGPSTFYHGSIAAASATFVGHYPWFFVYNYLSGIYPNSFITDIYFLNKIYLTYCYFLVHTHILLLLLDVLPRGTDTLSKLGRSALIGFCASAISDTCSNSIRVIKVYKQANTEAISYPEAIRRVIKEDGLVGLFGRGLSTKIVANGLQGLMFSVLWKLIDEQLFKKDDKKK